MLQASYVSASIIATKPLTYGTEMRLKETDVDCQAIEHLGLDASVMQSTGLIEKIDARIAVSASKGSKLSIGQRIAAMILNGLGFTNDRLYMFPSFLEDSFESHFDFVQNFRSDFFLILNFTDISLSNLH